jgi:hypothetical protein
MKGLLIFFLLWTPLCLLMALGLPLFFDLRSRLTLGLIIWLIGGLLGFYYIVARKWKC